MKILNEAVEAFQSTSFPVFEGKITDFENLNNIKRDYFGNYLRTYFNFFEEPISFSDIPDDIPTINYKDSKSYELDIYNKGVPCNEDIFETIDIIESVLFSSKNNKSFSMLETGAGYGFWTAIAHCLCKTYDVKNFYGLGVEPEPTRIAMYHRHMLDNYVEYTDILLGVISDEPSFFDFNIGNPYTAYGDSIQHSTGNYTIKVRGFSLGELLDKKTFWDLLDFDCQGAEETCFDNFKNELNNKVRKVSIATHSELADKKIPKIFSDWIEVWNFDSKRNNKTPFGIKKFVDGRKTYINPSYDN